MHQELLEGIRAQVLRDLASVSRDVRPLVALIAERLFARDLNVDLLHRSCSPSRKTLDRFEEQLGRVPRVYVLERRMDAAELLLTKTAMKIWQVAEAVGYSRKGFSPRFKKCRGRSPREVRRPPSRIAVEVSPPAVTQRLDARPKPPPPPRPEITLTIVEPSLLPGLQLVRRGTLRPRGETPSSGDGES